MSKMPEGFKLKLAESSDYWNDIELWEKGELITNMLVTTVDDVPDVIDTLQGIAQSRADTRKKTMNVREEIRKVLEEYQSVPTKDPGMSQGISDTEDVVASWKRLDKVAQAGMLVIDSANRVYQREDIHDNWSRVGTAQLFHSDDMVYPVKIIVQSGTC